MHRTVTRLAVLGFLAVGSVLLAIPSEAGAARTRPSRSAGGGSKPTASAPQRAGGQATYGHRGSRGYGYGGHHGRGGYYRHGGIYVGGGYYGGYPYYGWWGWPYGYLHYGYLGYVSQRVPVWNADSARLPAVVETDVRPKRATVLVDSVEVGQARDFNGNWDQLLLEPGRHTIEIRHPGHLTLRHEIDLAGGGYHRIAERLARGEGLDPRSVTAPPRAVDETAAPRPSRRSVETRIEGTLRQGLLHISASPDDAAVYLDGEFLARAGELARLHGAIPVARGQHILEVVRPGYEPRTLTVEIDGDEPARVDVSLDRKR